MDYFEVLDARDAFQEFFVVFFLVRHIEEHIDQFFSRTSARLRTYSVINLDYLHIQFRETF